MWRLVRGHFSLAQLLLIVALVAILLGFGRAIAPFLLKTPATIEEAEKVALSPDGKTLACVISAYRENEEGDIDAEWQDVRLCDLRTKRVRRLLRPREHVDYITFSPDGRTLAVGSSSGTVKLCDVATGRERVVLNTACPVTQMAFSPDGTSLALSGHDGLVAIWVPSSGKFHTLLAAEQRDGGLQPSREYVLAFTPDGRTVAAGGRDGQVTLWDASAGQPRTRIHGNTGEIHCLAISPDGSTVAVGGENGLVELWKTATARKRIGFQTTIGERLATFKNVYAPAFSLDGQMLATGGYDDTIRLWSLATGKERIALRPRDDTSGSYHYLAFLPDGKTLISGSVDGAARLWNLATGQAERVPLHLHTGVPWVVFPVAFLLWLVVWRTTAARRRMTQKREPSSG
ncbi:MAG: WD40 repeat domain-containing protein [Planctomycetes bacterium]|nr:WD40 repeat domain-containing protein [Planctomycetota bacterium]